MMVSYEEREVKATIFDRGNLNLREYVRESPAREDDLFASAFRVIDCLSGIDLGSAHCSYERASNWETRVENLSTAGRLICSPER